MDVLIAYNECQECDREIQNLLSKDYREENSLLLFPQKHRPNRKLYTVETDYFVYSTVTRIMESESCSFTPACEKLGVLIHVHEKKVARTYKRGRQIHECLRRCGVELGDRRDFARLAITYFLICRQSQRIEKIFTEKMRQYKQLRKNE